MSPNAYSTDCNEFISLLNRHNVRWVIVGGEAVIYYGYVRLTGDVDFFYSTDKVNIDNLHSALREFWSYNIPGNIQKKDLEEEGNFIQFGVPPNRIDLMNKIDGVRFEEVWNNRLTEEIETDQGNITVYYIGLNELIKNKRKSNRPKDLEDLKFLESRL